MEDDRETPRIGSEGHGISRRALLSGAALLGVGAGLDHVAFQRASAATPERTGVSSEAPVPFFGEHQAGIATAAQDYLHFAAFDLASENPEALRDLLERWTAAAATLTRGGVWEPTAQAAQQPPQDPGEERELGSAQLTITIGLGPSVFESEGRDVLGLASRRPPQLRALPAFQGDDLEPQRSGGDLCVQACANDPQVAFHAVHLLALMASDTATLRWAQLGFGRTSSTTRAQSTPRNLMGFKDGTDNIRSEEEADMRDFVWVQPADGPSWMVGGTYLIARRIRILFDVWDTTTLEDQERTIGRVKLTGAPLGTTSEYDPVDLAATASDGALVIPANAHIRLANPINNHGTRILRRGYSYSEAPEPGSGQIDAGLFFLAFQRSPERQFVPLQRRLAESDALNHHTVHTSSAIFACPPGAQEEQFVGEGLFS